VCNDGVGTTKFCCVFDEVQPVDTVEINGTPDADEVLSFTESTFGFAERNLQPWDSDPIEGYIRGNAGGDRIYGSNYAGSDYEDKLYGQPGGDFIFAWGGKDFISAGDNDDECWGGYGDDTIWGGDGNDDLYGEADADKLCDAAGYDHCANNRGNFMDGGSGNDKLWYDEDPNGEEVPCPSILLHDDSTAGTGSSDQCGDYNDYPTTDLPDDCESNMVTVAPVQCEGAN
jgi:Ca2+-binding RTX toxin-like protein